MKVDLKVSRVVGDKRRSPYLVINDVFYIKVTNKICEELWEFLGECKKEEDANAK